jgi:hypothetical protein
MHYFPEPPMLSALVRRTLKKSEKEEVFYSPNHGVVLVVTVIIQAVLFHCFEIECWASTHEQFEFLGTKQLEETSTRIKERKEKHALESQDCRKPS